MSAPDIILHPPAASEHIQEETPSQAKKHLTGFAVRRRSMHASISSVAGIFSPYPPPAPPNPPVSNHASSGSMSASASAPPLTSTAARARSGTITSPPAPPLTHTRPPSTMYTRTHRRTRSASSGTSGSLGSPGSLGSLGSFGSFGFSRLFAPRSASDTPSSTAGTKHKSLSLSPVEASTNGTFLSPSDVRIPPRRGRHTICAPGVPVLPPLQFGMPFDIGSREVGAAVPDGGQRELHSQGAPQHELESHVKGTIRTLELDPDLQGGALQLDLDSQGAPRLELDMQDGGGQHSTPEIHSVPLAEDQHDTVIQSGARLAEDSQDTVPGTRLLALPPLPSLPSLPSGFREALGALDLTPAGGSQRSEGNQADDQVKGIVLEHADDIPRTTIKRAVKVTIGNKTDDRTEQVEGYALETAQGRTDNKTHDTLQIPGGYSTRPPSLCTDSAPPTPASEQMLLLTPQLRHRASILSVHTIRRKPIKRTVFEKLHGDKYPHIIDRILSYLPPGQLASLRKVSKDFRDWVDHFLCFHVNIECYGDIHSAHAGAALLTVKVYRFQGTERRKVWQRVLRENNLDVGIEAIPENIVPAWMLARTRCLELCGPVGRTDVGQFAEGLLNLQTVRLCENGLGIFPNSCPFVAENIVAVRSKNLVTERRLSWDGDRTWSIPDGAKRLLINVHYSSAHNNGRVQPFSFPPSLKEVNLRFVGHPPASLQTELSPRPSDIIFHQIGPLRSDIKYNFIDAINFGALWSAAPAVKEPVGVLERTRRLVALKKPAALRKKKKRPIEHVDHMAAKNHCSYVGHLSGAMYEVNRRSAETALLAILREAVKSNQKRWKNADMDIVQKIGFLSLGEYKKHVARQQFIMETE